MTRFRWLNNNMECIEIEIKLLKKSYWKVE